MDTPSHSSVPPPSPDSALALAERIRGGEPVGEAEVRALLGALPEPSRALAQRLIELAREHAHWRRQLVQAAKLSEVGLSLAELIHELRQPLSGIAGYAQLLSHAPSSPEAPDWAQEIATQSARMQQLLERIRRFVRAPDDEGARVVDVSEALREATVVFPRLPPGVSVRIEAEPGLQRAVGEKSALVQVLVNLIVNARDAVVQRRQGLILLTASPSPGGVTITVADQGAGVPAEAEDRLFEPFATTKGDAGTGLGLYISREILRPWGAELTRVAPPEGFVTAFRIALRGAGPAEAKASPLATEAPASAEPEAGAERVAALIEAGRQLAPRLQRALGTRRVLLAEPDEAMRSALRILLASEPRCELVECADGPTAAQLLAGEPCDVLIAEHALPGPGGADLIELWTSEWPGAPLLILASRPTALGALAALQSFALGYVAKPLKEAATLRGLLRRALAQVDQDRLDAALGQETAILKAIAAEPSPPPQGPAAALVEAARRFRRRSSGVGRFSVFGPASLREAVSRFGDVAPLDGPDAGEVRVEAEGNLPPPGGPPLVWVGAANGLDHVLGLLAAGVVAQCAPGDLTGLQRACSRALQRARQLARWCAAQAVFDAAQQLLPPDPSRA